MHKPLLLLTALLLLTLPAHASDLAAWLAVRVDAAAPGAAPVFIPSYDVLRKSEFDQANANAAYTYDQALAICALLATGDTGRARRIGDALLYAQDHDRFWHDGRLRNAYAAGLVGEGAVKLPGYYGPGKGQPPKAAIWIEDGYQVGSATGNQAWAGLALMRLSMATGDKKYAEGARRLGHWLVDVVAPEWKVDSAGVLGLRGGFEEFEPDPVVLGWRSTEHNVDALALFRLLDKAYPNDRFRDGVTETRGFLGKMFSGARFEVGTTADGRTINHAYSGLDAQILPLLALYHAAPTYELDFTPSPSFYESLRYAERAHGLPGGFDFSDARGGIWAEGTAQAALLYRVMGAAKLADDLIAAREADAGPQGGVYAIAGVNGAPIETLSTGLQLGNGGKGEAWAYYRRIAVAPAAWLIMAEKGYNPLAE